MNNLHTRQFPSSWLTGVDKIKCPDWSKVRMLYSRFGNWEIWAWQGLFIWLIFLSSHNLMQGFYDFLEMDDLFTNINSEKAQTIQTETKSNQLISPNFLVNNVYLQIFLWSWFSSGCFAILIQNYNSCISFWLLL